MPLFNPITMQSHNYSENIDNYVPLGFMASSACFITWFFYGVFLAALTSGTFFIAWKISNVDSRLPGGLFGAYLLGVYILAPICGFAGLKVASYRNKRFGRKCALFSSIFGPVISVCFAFLGSYFCRIISNIVWAPITCSWVAALIGLVAATNICVSLFSNNSENQVIA